MNHELRRSAAHVFVESLDAPHLLDDDLHHLQRVLRVGPRDTVTVSDGGGTWAPGRLAADGSIEWTGERQTVAAAPAPIGVATAIAKGDRTEWVVQKLTEVGMDRIVLFESTRSVVRWDAARRARHLERLRRIAREAAMQSRRVRLPDVAVLAWADLVATEGAVLAEPGAGDAPTDGVRLVIVGPEGGFTADELDCGLPTVSLGEQILRVETAAVAAGVLLHAVRLRWM